jgi:transcriptional regulator with XRE-family HTH domain
MEAKKYLEKKIGPMTFANSLKAWREGADLSQENLAKKVGISRNAISRYETGKDFPGPKIRKALAKALKADVKMWEVYIMRDLAKDKGILHVEFTVKGA